MPQIERCRRGHIFSDSNTYIRPDNGHRECRVCRVLNAREARARKPQKPETERKFRGGYPAEMECRTCNLVKSTEEFGRRRGSRHKGGDDYRSRSCKACTFARERDYRLRKLYDMTASEYDVLAGKQGGMCGLCGRHPEPGKSLVVDHSHATGQVRGLLCQPCNIAVGFFETRIDVDRIRRYIAS